MTAELEALLDACWQAVAARPDRVAGRRVAVPRPVPTECRPAGARFATDFPVLAHLDAALALARRGDLAALADRFAAAAPKLPWSQNAGYTAANCSRAFLDGYAYAGIAGPEGPICVDAPRGGFLLMGPGVTYPAHNHAPREVYLLLTPGAEWQLDQGDWFPTRAGDLLFHDAWQMHAMRTLDAPMLAFAGWIEPGDRLSIGFAAGRG